MPAIASVAIKNGRDVAGTVFQQAAHFAQVLFAGERVDDAARAEEEQRFEERVRHQVKNTGGKRAYAQSQEHVAELADSGISENFLDVVLHKRNRCGENGGQRADDGDYVHGRGAS